MVSISVQCVCPSNKPNETETKCQIESETVTFPSSCVTLSARDTDLDRMAQHQVFEIRKTAVHVAKRRLCMEHQHVQHRIILYDRLLSPSVNVDDIFFLIELLTVNLVNINTVNSFLTF